MKSKTMGRMSFLFWVLLASMIVFGQTTSRVTGVVKDSSGALISKAQVTLTEEATGVPFVTTTSTAGTYVFDAVKPGVYTVKVTGSGFKTASYKGNVVTIGQPTEVNITLTVGAINEMVEVRGAAELVQTATSGNIGNLVDNAALNSLPIVTTRGRNTLALVELEPVPASTWQWPFATSHVIRITCSRSAAESVGDSPVVPTATIPVILPQSEAGTRATPTSSTCRGSFPGIGTPRTNCGALSAATMGHSAWRKGASELAWW